MDEMNYDAVTGKAKRAALPTTEDLLNSRKPVPDRCHGVYLLFLGELVVYVGQSVDLVGRIKQHRLDGTIKFDSYAEVATDPRDQCEVEAHYIREFVPYWNRCALSHRARVDRGEEAGWPPPGGEPGGVTEVTA